MKKLCLCIIVLKTFSFSQYSLSLSQSEVSLISNYTFSLTLSQPVTGSYSIKIQFPGEFRQNSLSGSRCNPVLNISPSVSCNSMNLTLYLQSPFSVSLASGKIIVFTIVSVINIDVAITTSSFQVYILTSTGNIVDSLTNGLSATFDPKVINQLTIAPANPVAGKLSIWNVNAYLTYEIPSSGYVCITFPSWNINLSPTPARQTGFFKGNLTVKCLYNFTEYNFDCAQTDNVLKIYPSINLIGNVSISIDSGLNPPSLQPVTGISMTTNTEKGPLEYYSNSNVSSTTGCKIQVNILLSNEKTNTLSDYTFSFTTCNPVSSLTQIWVLIPIEIGLALNTITGVFGLDAQLPLYTVVSQTIKITNPFNSYYDAGKFISFTVSSLRNPLSSQRTSSFEVYVMTNGYIADYISDSLSVIVAAQGINGTTIVPSSLVVNATATYKFQFQPQGTVPINSTILITFPPEVYLPDSKPMPVSAITGLSTSAQCYGSSNTLYLTQGFSAPSTSSIQFYVPFVKNSMDTKPTSNFVIQIYSDLSLNNLLFQDSSYSLTFSPGNLSWGSVTPSSYTTGDIATYKISVFANLAAKTSLIIDLPPEITLLLTTTQCIMIQGLSANDNCINTAQSISITVVENITGNVTFAISNLKNPASTKPCFISVKIVSANWYLVSQGDFEIAMDSLHSFSSAAVFAGSYSVGDVCSYTVSIVTYNALGSSASLFVTSSIDLSTAYCDFPYTCIYSSGLTIYLNSQSSAFSIQIRNVTNPTSLKPVQMNITSQDTYKYDYASIVISMTAPGSIHNIILSTTTSLISTQSTYIISYKPQHASIGSVIVSIPKEFTEIKSAYPVDSNNVIASAQSSTITFTALNPIVSGSYSISINTTSYGYTVDYGFILLNITCVSPCYKCSYKGANCTGCKDPAPYFYDSSCFSSCTDGNFDAGNYTCSKCPAGCYSCSGLSKCIKCTSGYFLYNSTCVDVCPGLVHNNTCLDACRNSQYFYNGTCLDACPSSNYVYDGSCVDACPNSKFVYNYTCLDACPSFKFANHTCVDACPSSAFVYNRTCVDLCPALTYNNQGVCFDCSSDDCAAYATDILIGEEPLSFTTAVVGTALVLRAAAVLGFANFFPAIIGISGGLEWGGWVGTLTQVAKSNTLNQRSLLDASNTPILKIFYILLIIILIRQIINMTFLIKYLKCAKNDGKHIEWIKKHRFYWVICCLMILIVSFKLIKFFFCGFLSLDVFEARFNDKKTIYRLILTYIILDIILISMPMVSILLYILSNYSTGTYIFILSIDVLILTIISGILSSFYIFKLLNLIKHIPVGNETVSVAVFTGSENVDSISEDFHKTGYEDRYAVIKKYLNNLKGFETQTGSKKIYKSKSLDISNPTENPANFLSFSEDLQSEPSVALSNDSDPKNNQSFDDIDKVKSTDNIDISDVQIEINDDRENFEFIEIDENDFEVVRIKCRDLDSVLTLRKGFEDAVLIDEFGSLIDGEVHYQDLRIVEVLRDTPAVGVFRHKDTGETFRLMRTFNNAQVIKDKNKYHGYNEYSLNSKRELLDATGIKSGHPLYWKFEDSRIKNRFIKPSDDSF